MAKLTEAEQKAYDGIIEYIKKQGSAYNNWYTGVATDAEERLFKEHNVPEKSVGWIYRTLSNDTAARDVAQALLDLGCDGGPGGGDSSTKAVYAYLKTSSTHP